MLELSVLAVHQWIHPTGEERFHLPKTYERSINNRCDKHNLQNGIIIFHDWWVNILSTKAFRGKCMCWTQITFFPEYIVFLKRQVRKKSKIKYSYTEVYFWEVRTHWYIKSTQLTGLQVIDLWISRVSVIPVSPFPGVEFASLNWIISFPCYFIA